MGFRLGRGVSQRAEEAWKNKRPDEKCVIFSYSKVRFMVSENGSPNEHKTYFGNVIVDGVTLSVYHLSK